MLRLNITRKAYVGSLTVCLQFTLVTLKDQCQGHSNLEGLYLTHEFLIQVCRKLEVVIPTAGVKQSAKALGPLVLRLFIV